MYKWILEMMTGKVYLIGAGPGDPELLTLKAYRLLKMADVVLYDRLVGKDIIALIPETAEKMYVGKAKSMHSLPQEEINSLLAIKAKEGNMVVRLKAVILLSLGEVEKSLKSSLKKAFLLKWFPVSPPLRVVLPMLAFL